MISNFCKRKILEENISC